MHMLATLALCALLYATQVSEAIAFGPTGQKYWWSENHERALKSAGPAAYFQYSLSIQGWRDGLECNDLRRKILVMAHLTKTYNTTSEVLLTAVRLDNSLTPIRFPITDFRCPIDVAWDAHDAWPADLTVAIKSQDGKSTQITIPTVTGADSYTMRAKVPGLSVSKYNGEVQRNIFGSARDTISNQIPINAKLVSLLRAQHFGWRYFDIPLENMPSVVERLAGPKAREALEGLQPNAYKADLLRLVLLYYIGGVWLDTKMVPLGPLDGILPATGGMLAWDIGRTGVFNAFMALPRGDPLALHGIQRIIYNVSTRFYGQSFLEITGPQMLHKVMQEHGFFNQPSRYALPWILTKLGAVIESVATRQTVMTVLNIEYRRKAVCSINKCHYGNLWKKRAVYYEKQCNPATGLNVVLRNGALSSDLSLAND